MGLCASACVQTKEEGPQNPKMSYVAPGQYKQSDLQPSERNSDRFYYIHDEAKMDQDIAKLDELTTFNEAQSALFDKILTELKRTRKSFEPSRNMGSAESYYAFNVEKTPKSRNDLEAKEAFVKEKFNASTDSYDSPVKRSNIRNGVLSIEIQKAKFLDPKLLSKYKLVAPYVVVKIHSNTDIRGSTDIHTFKEIKAFETLKNESSVTPEWDEMFEYNFVDEDRISMFAIGISLFYQSDKDDKPLQIGEEQSFSLSALINQKVQNKEIDFKDPIMKGSLAWLRVRFQFIYDLNAVKDLLLKEVKARIERMVKIRENHPEIIKHRPPRLSMRMPTQLLSRSNSLGSTSSNHDNDDNNNYYVAE